MRVIRVLGGSYLIVNGIVEQEYVFLGVGILLAVQGIMNWGCSSHECEVKEKADGKNT